MRNTLVLALSACLLVGCDPVSGTSRWATLRELPDVKGVARHIEGYPEIQTVQTRQIEGGRSVPLTGISKTDTVYRIEYSGQAHICGWLCFSVDRGEVVRYSQSLMAISWGVPQEWLDATVPIMKRIERDLEKLFGVEELTERVQVRYIRADPPRADSPQH